jgi:hypothetical protein
MNYEKLTLQRFTLCLKENKYQGLTGARRAIGKTDWSAADRARAHELANHFFRKEIASRDSRVRSLSASSHRGDLSGSGIATPTAAGSLSATPDVNSSIDCRPRTATDLINIVSTLDRAVERFRVAAELDPTLKPHFVDAVRLLAAAVAVLGETLPKQSTSSDAELPSS